MKKKISVIFICLILMILGFGLNSHARLSDNSDVPPRGYEMKDSPCGVNLKTNTPKTLTAGSVITIRWIETVDHTGLYHIEFSKASDKDWVRLKTIPDLQNNPATIPHFYETTITVPNINCPSCTIRVVQEMHDNHADMPTFYYSCGDIKIIKAKC